MEDSETVERRCDLPYGAEYAKSNRSTCKGCKQTIGMNSLRMSAREPSRFFDGLQDNWFHARCFYSKLKPGKDQINERSIRGVEVLKWDDQEYIREKNAEFKALSMTGISSSCNSYAQLTVEYSKTNRGKCHSCRNCFDKGEIKFGLKSNWYHLDCLLPAETRAKYTGTIDSMTGFNSLSAKDQDMLKENLATPTIGEENGGGDAETGGNEGGKIDNGTKMEVMDSDGSTSRPDTPSTSSSIKNEGTEEAPKPKRFKFQPKSAEDKKKEALKKQTELLWELKEGIELHLKKTEMKKLLELNGQIPPAEESKMVDLLVDCALFGKPARCPTCTDGQIVFSLSARTYICLGFMSEFTKCQYKNRNPVRSPFMIPYEMIQTNDWLKTVVVNRLHQRTYADEEEAVVARASSFKHLGARALKNAAEAYSFGVKSMGMSNGKSRQIIKNGTVVDAEFEKAEECHVHKDANGTLYMATLSSTDMVNNTNSYYKLNLFKEDKRTPSGMYRFHLFRSWGRVGTNVGGTSTDVYMLEEKAIHAFENLFLEKTGNEWKNRKYFLKKPGKFCMVETDYSEFEEVKSTRIEPGSLTKLHPSIKDVIMTIFNVDNMKTALKEFELDLDRMPLGKLSKKQIMSAYQVLKDLEQLFNERNMDQNQILDATNRFYTLIPHNFGMKSPDLLNSPALLKKKCDMLDSLLEIELAYSVLREDKTAEMQEGCTEDPVDVHYRKLNCNMEYVEPGTDEYKMVKKYLKNTHGKTHNAFKLELHDLIRLSRVGEKEKFKKDIGNRQLLWHGSRVTNYGGILSQGLRIAPPEAPATGYMFGKGVYFADMVSKSANYCHVGQYGSLAFLLLCDVACGKMQEERHAFHTTSYKKKEFNSVKGMGMTVPNPDDVMHHPDGYTVPYGKSMEIGGKYGHDYSLLYNEYIVYDVDQINMRYLVRAKYGK